MSREKRCTSIPYKTKDKKPCDEVLLILKDPKGDGETFICPVCDSIEGKALTDTLPTDALERIYPQ